MTWRNLRADLRESDETRSKVIASDARVELAGRVYRRRQELGLSQQELADEIGTGQANISRIETGDANPELDTLSKLAAALGYGSVGDLLPEATRARPSHQTTKTVPFRWARRKTEIDESERSEGRVDVPVNDGSVVSDRDANDLLSLVG